MAGLAVGCAVGGRWRSMAVFGLGFAINVLVSFGLTVVSVSTVDRVIGIVAGDLFSLLLVAGASVTPHADPFPCGCPCSLVACLVPSDPSNRVLGFGGGGAWPAFGRPCCRLWYVGHGINKWVADRRGDWLLSLPILFVLLTFLITPTHRQ